MLQYKVNVLSLTNLIKKFLGVFTLALMLILSQNANVVAGEQEDKITVRQHGGADLGMISIEAFSKIIKEDIKRTNRWKAVCKKAEEDFKEK